MKERLLKNREIIWKIAGIAYSLVLCTINFLRIFDNNFWGDEAFSVGLARMSFWEMISETAMDVHPPLHYIVEMVLYRVFGDHGWVYHLGAFIPYGLALIFIMTVIWERFGKEVAFLMVTFTSILSISVQYNVEVRMYSLAAFFVLISFYFLYEILSKGDRRHYIFFVLASLGAAYTHYYAMLTICFYYLALLIWTIQKRIPVKKLIITYAVTIIAYLPWGLVLMSTLSRTADDFWMTEIPELHDILMFIFEPGNEPLTMILLVLAIGSIIYAVIKNAASDESRWLIWGAVSLIGTIVMGLLASFLVRPVFLIRYIYPAVVAFWLAASVAICRLKYRQIIAIILIVMTLSSSVPLYREENKVNKAGTELCDKTYNDLSQIIHEGDTIWTNGGHLNWTILDCYFENVDHKKITRGYDGLEAGPGKWLLWTYDLENGDYFWLNYRGFEVEEVYHDGLLGDNWIHLYKIMSRKNT